ncbi:MAG: glucose-1-phosphate adenylyltransferase, partial [Clostridia bacterium]
RNPGLPPHYLAAGSKVTDTLLTEGCQVEGEVTHSVLFAGVHVHPGAFVKDAVIMPRAVIERGAVIERAIIAEGAIIAPGCQIGGTTGDIAVVGQGVHLPAGMHVLPGEQIDTATLAQRMQQGKEA